MRSNPAISQHLLSQLLALRPYIEHILCEGSRDPHVRAAVEDQVQTVMRKASRYLPLYRPHREGLRPWVTRIAVNVRTDAHRSAQSYDNAFGHDHVAAEEAADPGPSPESDAQTRAFLEKVFAHIEEMPPEMREVLLVAVSCGNSQKEIAARLELTEGAAKMRLSRARQMLRKRAGSLRDHLPLWLLLFFRKFPAPRGLRLNRLRTFFWRTGQLLPPLIVWFVALPHVDRTAPIAAENIVVPERCGERTVRHDVPVGKLEAAPLPSVHDVSVPKTAKGKPLRVAQPSPLPPYNHSSGSADHHLFGR